MTKDKKMCPFLHATVHDNVLQEPVRLSDDIVLQCMNQVAAFILYPFSCICTCEVKSCCCTCEVKSCCCSWRPSRRSQQRTVLSRPPVQSLVPSLEMSMQLAPSVWPWNCLSDRRHTRASEKKSTHTHLQTQKCWRLM